MKTSDKIVTYLVQKGNATGKELYDHLGTITARAVRKQLKSMLEKGIVRKMGKPPKVFYTLSSFTNIRAGSLPPSEISRETQRVIDERYLYISPAGIVSHGVEGFREWCAKTNQEVVKTADEYVRTLRKYDAFRTDNLIDGMSKLRNTFATVYLDRLYYMDFYSIERFGKTKLGQMLLYAKQSQDRSLIRSLVTEIQPKVHAILNMFDIDGVLFVPPTVKREVQFMRELEQDLQLRARRVPISKIKTPIIVPQKTLSKLDDRVENARNTLVVEGSGTYGNILLIDDAVGSGATLNETAAQIKKRGMCRGLLIGLAITGSFKGFDVISEV